MQQSLFKINGTISQKKGNIDDLYFGCRTEIKNKIQNDPPEFNLIDAISDISVASYFTTLH